MTENQFLTELNHALSQLPEEERNDIMQDIQEYFSNGRQDGKSDFAIASELGPPQTIAKELAESYDFAQTKNTDVLRDTFDKVDIQLDTGSLLIGPSADSEMRVDIKDKDYKQQFSTDIVGHTLVVTLKNEKKWGLFSFNVNTKSPVVTVELPPKTYEHIKLQTGSGRIEANRLQSVEFLAESDNGRIQLREIAGNQLIAESDNGALELRKIQSDAITAKTDNGKIEMQDVLAKKAKIETDNGSILMANVEGDIQAETDNGRITLQARDIERNIDLKTDNGGIVVETMNAPINVTIQADRDNGKAAIFNEKAATSSLAMAATVSG
ncbi:DUF4097 family beta strand repeat-containing protein [Planomicrobium sp. CPCC 101079]|uniref:DUF4097 family beta strand repeat-containing protein n=1 Tax=Planomicrobium sp. CPCC 101079 TaxID=2599618 RepID=UPI0011B5576E|nr:DUF4097 family beta strand repeat-containing protein [Planomicrobium sp. CPCC 101079]TWT16088.1 DUF4097 family beta strand repeat protein [Planomicrobium sp. CPCC 101079]